MPGSPLKFHIEAQIARSPTGGTRLMQEQTLQPHGLLRLLWPIIRREFDARVKERLSCLKIEMEGQA